MDNKQIEDAGSLSGGGAEHVSERLPEYVRGTLAPAETDRVEAHLALCVACREEAEVVGLLESVPLPRLSETERARVYAEVVRRRSAPGFGWRSVAWRAAAAIALLLAGVGVWRIYGEGEGGTPWSPAPAVAALERDLEELGLGVEEVRLALGVPEAAEEAAAWTVLGADDPAAEAALREVTP